MSFPYLPLPGPDIPIVNRDGRPQRDFHRFLRSVDGARPALVYGKRFTFADDGATFRLGTVPAGTLIEKQISGVHVLEAFNAGSTNVLDIGIDGDADLFGTDLALGSLGFVACDEAAGVFHLDAEAAITITVDLTGSAPDAGIAVAVVHFVPLGA